MVAGVHMVQQNTHFCLPCHTHPCPPCARTTDTTKSEAEKEQHVTKNSVGVRDLAAVQRILEGAEVEQFLTGPAVDFGWVCGRTRIGLILRRPNGSRLLLSLFAGVVIEGPLLGNIHRLPPAGKKQEDKTNEQIDTKLNILDYFDSLTWREVPDLKALREMLCGCTIEEVEPACTEFDDEQGVPLYAALFLKVAAPDGRRIAVQLLAEDPIGIAGWLVALVADIGNQSGEVTAPS